MEFAVPWSTIKCNACGCMDGGRACDICIHFNFNCKGTCRCCVESRRVSHPTSRGQGPSTSRGQGPSTSGGQGPSTSGGQGPPSQGPSTSRGQGPSRVKQNPDSLCAVCDCCRSAVPCRKCTRSYLKCPGTCPCCDQSKNTVISVDEKYLDNLIRNSVITSLLYNDNPILLVPLGNYITLPSASGQNLPAPQKIKCSKLPSHLVSTSPSKNRRRILCTQCFCEADEIPCEICRFNNSDCRGSCPCCNKKSRQRALNPNMRLESDPICPRCTKTPGEGFCDYCRQVAKENAAAWYRFQQRKRQVQKPAILQHKKKNLYIPVTVQAKEVEQIADSKAVFEKRQEMIKCHELRLKKQNAIREEYCLQCQCKRGSEPCMACLDGHCYGNCECCKELNWRLLDKEQLMANAPGSRQVKEGQAKRHAAVAVPRNDCRPSTSRIHVDHSYPQSLKCELCDCYKYSRPCNDCLDNNTLCVFTGDNKICLCCTIKLIVL